MKTVYITTTKFFFKHFNFFSYFDFLIFKIFIMKQIHERRKTQKDVTVDDEKLLFFFACIEFAVGAKI